MIKSSARVLSLLFCLSLGLNSRGQELQKVTEYLTRSQGFSAEEFGELEINHRLENPKLGATHLYLNQVKNGLRLLNGSATATLRSSTGQVLNVGERFKSLKVKSIPAADAQLSLTTAVSKTLDEVGIKATVSVSQIDSRHFLVDIASKSYNHTSKAELGYLSVEEEKSIHLVWNFDFPHADQTHWYSYFVDANTGAQVNRVDWQVSCSHTEATHQHSGASCGSFEEFLTPFDGSGYRVLPFPVESPNHGSRALISQPAVGAFSPFGWHDTNGLIGPEFTITRGNNVFAYDDVDDSNQPGFSPDGGTGLLFDYPYNQPSGPDSYLSASITNLFYANNRIHDLLAVYGFDEPSGNFQETNYTGEGLGNDFVRAEAQDGGGTNNANMATPPEGNNPRMQMFLWIGSANITELFTINAPSALAGTYQSSDVAAFGPSLPAGGITADAIFLTDADGPDFNDGCTAATNGGTLSGKIAFVYRGTCNFTDKVISAQNAGAVACVVINNQGGLIAMGGANNDVNIPSVMITQALGQQIATNLSNGNSMNITLNNTGPSNILDGSFDNGIVIHEYVHGLSNRLTGGPSEAGCLGNEEQMGEGWSDWYATMLTMDLTISNPTYRPMGTFASGVGTQSNGIRPAPYDTSFAVNAFTYANLPNGNISIPHGVGFIWATMLWDLTWALIDDHGFDANLETGVAGNNIALQLVTEALKLQVCEPGFVDGRDAILLADELLYAGENKCLIWEVFAKRGLGFSASQGSSQSRSDGIAAFDIPAICQEVFLPPSAAFNINEISNCTGTFVFSDLSENVPQSWFWEFGDGNTSFLQNPTHMYDEPGEYQVTLTVSNTLGEDTFIAQELLVFEPIAAPIVPLVSIVGCAGDVFPFSAINAEGVVKWYDESGTLIAEGETVNITVGESNENVTLFAEIDDFDPVNVGPVDGSIGNGNNHATDFIGTVDFAALQPLRVQRAWVISGAIGERTINLWSGSSAGVLIDQRTVNVDFIGGGWINLNFDVAEAGQYSMGLNQANFFRNNGGVDYPYSVSDLISINGSSAGTGLYYYFYDIQVDRLECRSDSTGVQVISLGNAIFATSITDLTVNFSPSNTQANSYLWDFGDATTSTEVSPVHTYADGGIYMATLTIDGECSSDATIDLIVQSIGEIAQDGWEIFPNPANDRFTLQRRIPENDAFTIRIIDLNGRQVRSIPLQGSFSIEINISTLANGVYVIDVADPSGNTSLRQKLVVAH